MEDQDQSIEPHSTSQEHPRITPQADLKRQLYHNHSLPTGSRCIRVLDILPNSPTTSNEGNDILKCRPRVIDLDDSPSFTALSYVWGTYSPEPHYVLCDNVPIEVTSNCLSALKSLGRKLGTVSIWVDAICINQSDQAEKSRQIPLMGSIYSVATVVYVWLGPGTDRTDRVMAYLDKIPLERYFKATKQGRSSPRIFAAGLFLSFLHLRPRHHPLPLRATMYYNKPIFGGDYITYEDLEDFLSCTWVTRVWTYQEILLASNPVVVCGVYHIPWQRIECSILFLDSFRWISGDDAVLSIWASLMKSRINFRGETLDFQAAQGYNAHDYLGFVEKALSYHDACLYVPFLLIVIVCGPVLLYPALTLIVRASFGPKNNVDEYPFWAVALVPIGALFALLSILYTIRLILMMKVPWITVGFSEKTRLIREDLILSLYLRHATNPKDMAFGMWAVLEHQNSNKLATPDYSLDIGSIYRTFSGHIYETNKSLESLLFAAIKGMQSQPSWVADWSAPRLKASKNGEFNVFFQETLGDSARRLSLRRSKLEEECLKFEINDASGILTADARYLGKIKLCAEFSSTNDHYEEVDKEIYIRNISALMQWASGAKEGRWRRSSWWMPGIDTHAPAFFLDSKTLHAWAALFSSCGSNDAPKILHTLRERPHLLEQHIRVCNQLAEGEIMVFSATWMDGQSSQMSLKGLCLRGAEPGDRLLHIEGMPYLLIVRELDEDKTVKIIGPVGAPSEWIEDRWRFTAEEKKRLWACDDNIQFEKFKFR